MSISSPLYLDLPSVSAHGAVAELRSSVRGVSRGALGKRHSPGGISSRSEEIGRNCRGNVSCSVAEGSAERLSTPGRGGECDDVIAFYSGREMGAAETNRSSAPLGSVSNALFTIESTPLLERMESFDKMGWRGKVTVSAMVVGGLAAASFAGVKLARGLHGGVRSLATKKSGAKEGGGSLAYDVVAKGFATVQENLGPWSFSDLTLGLAAISKVRHVAPVFYASVPGVCPVC